MFIILILAKFGIIGVYASLISMILRFKKSDRNVLVEFDLLSRIELCASIGIGLVGLVCVIDPSTYAFSLILCMISISLALAQRYRIVLAGDTKVLFGGKEHFIRDIKRLGSGMFTLHIYKKMGAKPYRIYVPLTSNNVLKNRVQAKVNKKSK